MDSVLYFLKRRRAGKSMFWAPTESSYFGPLALCNVLCSPPGCTLHATAFQHFRQAGTFGMRRGRGLCGCSRERTTPQPTPDIGSPAYDVKNDIISHTDCFSRHTLAFPQHDRPIWSSRAIVTSTAVLTTLKALLWLVARDAPRRRPAYWPGAQQNTFSPGVRAFQMLTRVLK